MKNYKNIAKIFGPILLLWILFGNNPFNDELKREFESSTFSTVCGNKYKNPKRFLLSDTPQEYTYETGRYVNFWYDNSKTGEVFEFRFSSDGDPIDSDKISYVPSNVLWVSKKPDKKAQWITLAYIKK